MRKYRRVNKFLRSVEGVGLVYYVMLVLIRWQWDLGVVWLFGGGLIGILFEYVDRLVYVYVVAPKEKLCVHVKRLVEKKRYKEVVGVLKTRGFSERRLPMRSVIFMAAWVPMAFFLVTSTGSMLAIGLVMGVGLHLLYDVLLDWYHPRRIKKWLLWPIARPVSDREVKIVVVVYAVLFGVMSLLV